MNYAYLKYSQFLISFIALLNFLIITRSSNSSFNDIKSVNLSSKSVPNGTNFLLRKMFRKFVTVITSILPIPICVNFYRITRFMLSHDIIAFDVFGS